MLLAFAAAAVAGTLTINGPAKWDVSVSKTGQLPAAHVDVVLKNEGRVPLVWQLSRVPSWAVCPLESPRPEAGQKLTGSIPPLSTSTVRVDLIYVPLAYKAGTKYVDEIAFYAISSTAKEVSVPCSMTVTP